MEKIPTKDEVPLEENRIKVPLDLIKETELVVKLFSFHRSRNLFLYKTEREFEYQTLSSANDKVTSSKTFLSSKLLKN